MPRSFIPSQPSPAEKRYLSSVADRAELLLQAGRWVTARYAATLTAAQLGNSFANCFDRDMHSAICNGKLRWHY